MGKPKKQSKNISSGAKKFEWQQCEKCGCVMNSRYFDDHEVHWGLHFSKMKTRMLDELLISSSTQGFFIGQRFFTFVNDSPSEIFNELKHFPRTTILLHPIVMQRLNLTVADEVVISNSSNHQTIASVWPSDSVRIGNILLHPDIYNSFCLRAKEWIMLEPYEAPKLYADTIYLKVLNVHGIDELPVLKSKLRLQIDKKYLYEGSKVIIRHMTNDYEFLVVKIIEKVLQTDLSFVLDSADFENVTINKTQSFNVSQLSESLRDLSIRDSPELNSTYEFDSQCKTSVPTDFINSDDSLPNFYFITDETEIIIPDTENLIRPKDIDSEIQSSIGGLKNQKKKLENLLNIKKNSHINSIHTTGIILHGPSGTGKTTLVRFIAAASDYFLISVHPSTIFSKLGQACNYLKELFDKAKQNSPSIIFFDKFDLFSSKQHKLLNDLELNTVKQCLLTLLDELYMSKETVIVLAETSKIEELDPDFRRQGRFDEEIKFNAPNEDEREDIVNEMLKDIQHSLSEKDVRSVASETHAFVASDLEIMCSKAKLHAINCTSDGSESRPLTLDDIQFALKKTSPSGMRGLELKVPEVFWKDIAIKEETKMSLEQIIMWPIQKPHLFKNLHVLNRNALLYGPPGCSKTLIAKALATETGLNFIAVKSSELISKYFGDSEHAINNLFARARLTAPSIIFFDEFDGLAMKNVNVDIDTASMKIRSQLAIEFDKTKPSDNVAVLAATNRPDLIDDAFLSASRLGTRIYVPLPDAQIRQQIFKITFRKMPIADDINIEDLTSKTDTFSGAEIVQLCHNAARIALRENGVVKGVVKAAHFTQALLAVKPKISDALIQQNELYFQTTKNQNYLAYM